MNIKTMELIYNINRWWSSGRVDDAFLYKKARSEFGQIIDHLDDRRILSVIGPRRVGKSTLLYQTIDYLLKRESEPKRIFFFSGDEPGLLSNENNLNNLIMGYIKDVLSEKLEDIKAKIYIVIDEIHFIKDWQLYLKSYYDKKYNIKFIVSGSSSTHMFHHSRESLLGRIDDIFILPASFKQFADFCSVYKTDAQKIVPDIEVTFCSPYTNIKKYYDELKTNYFRIKEYEVPLNRILKEYLLVGGYPEYFESPDIFMWQKRLVEDIIARGLYRDIVMVYNVKNPEILEKLIYFIAANQGQPFSLSTLGQTVGVDTATVSAYLNYLAQAFLVGIQDNYSPNAGKIIRKNKKLFVIDNGIKNALLRISDINPSTEGHLVENCAVHNVKLYAESMRFNLFYWRDDQKEVDIVLDTKTQLIPFEIKYRTQITMSDLKGIKAFMAQYDLPCGIVITKDLLDFNEGLYFIPFWIISMWE